MKFFVDNNLSPQLANGMKAFGEDVIHITEILPDNTDDTEYLPRVGSEGWFLVTRDNRIRYRPAPIASLPPRGGPRSGTFSMPIDNHRRSARRWLIKAFP